MLNNKILSGGGLLVLVVLGHFIALGIGLYASEIIWIDKVWHFLVGAAFALIFLGIAKSSRRAFFLVLGLAVVWEILEFAFLSLYPSTAHNLQIFSPSIVEASLDIAFNAIGALVALAILKHSKQ